MAEIALKIKRDLIPEPSYQDGDIIVAINDRRIKDVYAQHICKPNGFNRQGLRTPNSLLETYLSNVYEYKFQRISKNKILRTNLITFQQEILSNKPNSAGERIDVDLYISKRIQHHIHKIFGEKGSEYWYGGHINNSSTTLDIIWNDIENKTSFRKINFQDFPFTDHELKQHLIIKTDDFTEEQKTDFESDLKDKEGNIIKKRTNYIIWRNLLNKNVSDSDIINKDIKVDIRKNVTYDKNVIQKR